MFELLQGVKVFTQLNLHNVYHLLRIQEGGEWKTAFNSPNGHYKYLIMTFGVTNAPAVFQAMGHAQPFHVCLSGRHFNFL